MGHEIRSTSASSTAKAADGNVEADETYIGAGSQRPKAPQQLKKTAIFAMLDRESGEVIPTSCRTRAAGRCARSSASTSTRLDHPYRRRRAYKLLAKMGYTHSSVNHRKKEYAAMAAT